MIRVGVDVGGTFTDIVLEQTTAGESQKSSEEIAQTGREHGE